MGPPIYPRQKFFLFIVLRIASSIDNIQIGQEWNIVNFESANRKV